MITELSQPDTEPETKSGRDKPGRYEHGFTGRADQRNVVATRRVAHGLLSLAFGVVGLIALAATCLFVARGLLYGVVDDGPYDQAWGGPTLAGAWAVHLAVALGAQLVVIALVMGVAGLQRRSTGWLHGDALPRWFAPVTAVVCVAVALFLVAFVRQL